ncbi:MAG: hypothetical protein MJ172_01650 [Clostridia bacterium]|nr:hypothetical protein [Clostridia bacterium]
MSVFTSFSMFFLSFAPLWLSVIFIDAKSLWEHTPTPYTEIISISLILGVTLLSLINLMIKFNPNNLEGTESYILESAKEEKMITSEFLLSYILPLFAFNFTVWHEVVLFLIFFSIFAFLCIRHNHFSVNIVLEFMRYRFYVCELSNDDDMIINKTIITQDVLPANLGQSILIKEINNEFSVQAKQIE